MSGCDLDGCGECSPVAPTEGAADERGWTVAIGAVACDVARS
jgi:hypothetical protein